MRISDWSSDVCSSDLPTHQLPPFRSTPYHEPIYPLRFSSCQIGSEAYSTTVTKDLGPERSTTAASDLLRLLSSPTSAPCRTAAPIPCASSRDRKSTRLNSSH